MKHIVIATRDTSLYYPFFKIVPCEDNIKDCVIDAVSGLIQGQILDIPLSELLLDIYYFTIPEHIAKNMEGFCPDPDDWNWDDMYKEEPELRYKLMSYIEVLKAFKE